VNRFLLGACVVLGLVTVAVGASAATRRSEGAASPRPPLILIEHALSDTITHTGGGSDAVGDVLNFHNDVYDAGDRTKVGTDNGMCIRTVFAAHLSEWECNWTTSLAQGSFTVEGPYFDVPTDDTVVAITGGTGAYRGAHGQMRLHLRNPTEFEFVTQLRR
jgi:hypothetical protein